MTDMLTFRFPMPPNLANSRMHYMAKHKSKTSHWAMCDLLAKGGLLPKKPKSAPWDKAVVASQMVVGALHDHDNAVARHKFVLDWLVKRGYLVDDSPKHLRWEGFPTQRVSRKNEPSITLTLTKVEG